MERIQVLLNPAEREILQHLAREAGTSMYRVVRNLLQEKLKEKRRSKMREAAEMMAEEYRNDIELTAGIFKTNRPALTAEKLREEAERAIA